MEQGVKIRIADSRSIHFVSPEEILRIKADGNYSYVYLTNGQKVLTAKTLKEYQVILEDYHFFRIHHKHLINLRCVKEFIRDNFGVVVLDDQTEIPLSRRKRVGFLDVMNESEFVIKA